MNRLLAITLALTLAGAAHGHGDKSEQWRAVADAPREPLVVQVYNSPLGKQIVVANTGDETLEIDGPDGRPFLRIGPDGVSADYAAPAWYATQNPGERPLPEHVAAGDGAPRWQRVRVESHWGWFDPRLVPTDAHASSEEKRWRIPARLGGETRPLTGRFLPLSAPREWRYPRLSRESVPPDLGVRLIPDPAPAIMAEYRGVEPLVVLDRAGEPMLRFTADGVYANPASAGWQALGRPPRSESGAGWVSVSPTPRYSWPDRRLLPAASPPAQWRIPIVIEGRQTALTGDWVTVQTGQR